MKYEEYEKALQDVVKNPDAAAISVQEILKNIKSDCETMASLEAGISERDGRIRTLQDTNQSLFLQVTGGSDDQDLPEEKSPDVKLDELFKEE